MGYTNSPLVSYTKISPNKTSPRNHKIDTITIHCVVGQCSVETLGEIFAKESRQASSNYGIGFDGRIGMYVEEKDRSWCSSNAANDHRAITIEVASDTTHPYAVNDKAYAALLDLVTDICKRNGIKQLVWSTDKNQRVNHLNGCNMTVHRDYTNKSCPGDYLYNRHGEIAAEVNRRLNAEASPSTPETPKVLYRVQTGAFSVKSNADALAAKLKAKGFEAFITTESGTPVTIETPKTETKVIKVGSKVKIKQNAPVYGKTTKFQSLVYPLTWIVHSMSGDRVVVNKDTTGKYAIMSPVKLSDLTIVE